MGEFTYGEAVEAAFETGPKPLRRFARIATLVINLFICMTQYGFCIVYPVFIADNISQVVFGLTGFHMDIRFYMLILTAILIPLTFIKNLKTLSPFSMMAN